MKIYKRFCALLLALLAAALLLPVGASAAGSIDLGFSRASVYHDSAKSMGTNRIIALLIFGSSRFPEERKRQIFSLFLL